MSVSMKLAKYLSDNKITATALAQDVGVAQPTIHRYMRNERFPDPEMIERISMATKRKVTVADWYAQAAEHRASKTESAA